MTTSSKKRVSAGVPTGGQFATTGHTESDITLDSPMASTETWPEDQPAAGSVVNKQTVFTQRYDTLEEKLAAIQVQLHTAVEDLVGDDEWNSMLETMSKFPRYSFGNQMLISLQTEGRATQVAGYRKWTELNRNVRAGEKGIVILAPKKLWVAEKDDNGKAVLGADGKPRKKTVITGFTTATVFDASQTEGEELPDPEKAMLLSETPPAGFREDLETAIAESGFTVSYEPIPGTARGYTDPLGRRVVIREGLPEGNLASTLAHELAHIKAGHLERVDEYHMGHNGSRDAMEIEAESVAHALCAVNGMDSTGKSGRYVAAWGRTNPERIRQAAETVAKTVKNILDTSQWRNSTVGTTATPAPA